MVTSQKNGVLVHSKMSDVGKEWLRVVVPSDRRQQVLDVAHKGLAGGHFSHNKMVASLQPHFTWPGIRKDARQYCRTCPECQKAGRHLKQKAPIATTPIISVPYERLACDLVGPLPRTKRGFNYILTVMCLGTRYPYAIPLKKVDAISVAEGLLEVVAHTGIPHELLSDQGSVFMGRLNKELCRLLDITKLRTTAYHPQTNGILERWHSCLKGMLRKASNSKEEWDNLLKYCLLAYRATPHAATGFSPYELIHGRALRGPLQAMKEGWGDGQLSFKSSVEWVSELRVTLAVIHQAARDNEQAFKEKSKAAYDQGAQARSFKPRDQVLCHNPNLSGKLDSIWKGPYVVLEKLSELNYRIGSLENNSKNQVVHINRLKPWETQVANLFRVVVADETAEMSEPVGKMKMGTPELTEEQQVDLQLVLEEFGDVVTEKLGKVKNHKHTISTGDIDPIRSDPYRIAPGWRTDLKSEIDELLKHGIIVPSRSPWSSPMVPVRKHGTKAIRLCIDYRKLNKATNADPFQMPLIQELLDNVAGAKWLTELDMNKGFYQVPLDQDSEDKTAFCSPWGKYAFTRMPFGLMNAPATFQRCMNETLGQHAHCSSTYIDDVLVYSNSWEEHLAHLHEILASLRQAGLTAKPSKCVWGATSLEYLGHKIGRGLVDVPEARVKALRNYIRPINQKGIRAFLGTVNYYRKFIPNCARWAAPLNDALKKGAPGVVEWNKKQCTHSIILYLYYAMSTH